LVSYKSILKFTQFTGVDGLKESPCPITGEYTGLIPDASGLCARLFSDCENPESMHYKVYNCYNASDVYEGQYF
jgi:hypothetical protein